MRRLWILMAVLGTFGCGSSESSGGGTPGEKYSGIMPAESCAPGTRPRIGQETCAPVGTTACAAGFRPSSSMWGCEAIIPTPACTGAERAVIGSPTCVPVDDCSAAFPPPEADQVVTDTASLANALKSVPSGSTIALDAGTYSSITITKSVKLVGRCAKDVIFQGPGERGIFMQTNLEVGLRSLTVQGFTGGVVASYGPSVSLTRVILADNTLGLIVGEAKADIRESLVRGIIADTPAADGQAGGIAALWGSTMDVTDAEIRDERSPFGAYDPNTQFTVKRSVVEYTGPVETARVVSAFAGAKVLIEESTLRSRNASLVGVGKELPITYPEPPPAAEVRIVRSELRQSGANLKKDIVNVSDGAHFELEDSTLSHQSFNAIGVGGATVKVKSSVISSEDVSDFYRSALYVTMGASAELDSVAVISPYQNGVLVAHAGSKLTLRGSLVRGTEFRGPGPNAELGGSAIAVGAADKAQLVVEDSALVENTQFSLYVDTGALLDLRSSLVDQSVVGPGGWGEGIVVGNGSLLAATGSMVRGSADAALAVARAGGKVENTAFLTNGLVVHIDGARLVDQDGQIHGAGSDLVFAGNVFFQNGDYVRNAPLAMPLIDYH